MTRPSHRLAVAALLAVFVARLAWSADSAGPIVEPLDPIKQEKRDALPGARAGEIKFSIKAKGDAPLTYRLIEVSRGDKTVPQPPGMILAADTGAFTWTPTPSQVGSYEIRLAVKDKHDGETRTSIKITVPEGPITAMGGPVGELLKRWAAEGTAAGNTGDFYDNRDRDHSALNMQPFPQLDAITYTDEERKTYRDWALAVVVRPTITFGNSSTSAPPTMGGSNVRSVYVHPEGLAFLYTQYRGNNLYMYPAHHDHHPGRNGRPFYGDLYPANSPYLITSQGSSGTDQPFMRAVPLTLAAFRPEVKEKLAKNGLLMPTVQMILRSSNKHLTDPKEYLTGKAHPPVFEGSWVDDLKMVQAAHAMTADNLPPMIQLKVTEEDAPVVGRDYFEAGLTEKIGDSPCAIARIIRGTAYERRMVVSAGDSFDINKKPLTYHWAVLRGDRDRVHIKPLNESGSLVELRVAYHARRPVEGAPLAIESNRVDIGAFVHNGTYYSAPGFVTFFSQDHEARTYATDGRLLEVGYNTGETHLDVTDWPAVFDLIQSDGTTLAGRLLHEGLPAAVRTAIGKVGEEYAAARKAKTIAEETSKPAAVARDKAAAALKTAQEQRKKAEQTNQDKPTDASQTALELAKKEEAAAEEARKKAEADFQAAQKVTDAADRAANDLLTQKRPGLEASVTDLVRAALNRAKDEPTFSLTHRPALEELIAKTPGAKERLTAARKRLTAFGILAAVGDGWELRSVRPGDQPVADRLTRYERDQLERFHGELLSVLVYPKVVNSAFRVNLVDQRLATAKDWRDVYRYDAAGRLRGWVRQTVAGETEFATDGRLIVEKDKLGRPFKVRVVRYQAVGKWPELRTLKPMPSKHLLAYEYADDQDVQGKLVNQGSIRRKKASPTVPTKR